jgi:hypothetical protein
MSKIKMPAKLLKKWLKALRSGEYKQASGTLYDTKTAGFCCLGVLQHVSSGGKCEVDSDGDFECVPSRGWYADNSIDMPDEAECALMHMNDGKLVWTEDSSKRVGKRKFPAIADYIEKNTETF